MINVESKIFEKVNFSIEPLVQGNYEKCTFRHCDFSEVDLDKINFYECIFLHCNLSLVKFSNITMNDVSFHHCKMLGVHFEHCNDVLFTVDFDTCTLNLSSFYRMKAKKTIFKGCTMHEMDFTDADLSGAVFDRCDLSGSAFHDTNLEKADLSSAYNYLIDPESNRVKKAKFAMNGLPGLLYKYDLVIEE